MNVSCDVVGVDDVEEVAHEKGVFDDEYDQVRLWVSSEETRILKRGLWLRDDLVLHDHYSQLLVMCI